MGGGGETHLLELRVKAPSERRIATKCGRFGEDPVRLRLKEQTQGSLSKQAVRSQPKHNKKPFFSAESGYSINGIRQKHNLCK
jgi:hypothetical protein